MSEAKTKTIYIEFRTPKYHNSRRCQYTFKGLKALCARYDFEIDVYLPATKIAYLTKEVEDLNDAIEHSKIMGLALRRLDKNICYQFSIITDREKGNPNKPRRGYYRDDENKLRIVE